MTLTTEQLRARAKLWREKAVEAKWESVSIAQDMLQNADAFDELAANREAQPDLYLCRVVRAGETLYSPCGKDYPRGRGYYTTPPAVAAELDYNRRRVAELEDMLDAPPAYPERLPCPVRLMPGLLFGKGIQTVSMLEALNRREAYEAEVESMTPEQKAEDNARIEAFKALLPKPPAPTVPDNVREALTLALQAMEFMGDTLNNIDAVRTEDVEYVTPAFNAVRELLAAAPEGGN